MTTSAAAAAVTALSFLTTTMFPPQPNATSMATSLTAAGNSSEDLDEQTLTEAFLDSIRKVAKHSKGLHTTTSVPQTTNTTSFMTSLVVQT